MSLPVLSGEVRASEAKQEALMTRAISSAVMVTADAEWDDFRVCPSARAAAASLSVCYGHNFHSSLSSSACPEFAWPSPLEFMTSRSVIIIST